VLLTVFHNRRWDADIRTLVKVLDSGDLGGLWRVHSRFDLDDLARWGYESEEHWGVPATARGARGTKRRGRAVRSSGEVRSATGASPVLLSGGRCPEEHAGGDLEAFDAPQGGVLVLDVDGHVGVDLT
jgi:hypothetical protein